LPLVDIEAVEGETLTRLDLTLNLSNLRTQRVCVVVTTTSQLDVVASIESSDIEATAEAKRSQ
jgi:hypothetical protein